MNILHRRAYTFLKLWTRHCTAKEVSNLESYSFTSDCFDENNYIIIYRLHNGNPTLVA